MAQILDGKKVRSEALHDLKKEVSQIKEKLTLAIVQVGSRADSNSYIKAKKKFGEEIGVEVKHLQFSEDIRDSELIEHIETLNTNSAIHGIIVQLPLPLHMDRDRVINSINPQKDVDGLGIVNIQKLWGGHDDGIIPATTRGILSLLKYYNIELHSKKVTIVGRSLLVGKPTVLMCINENATVTVCHSKTENLEQETKNADILIVAIGKPEFIKKNHVKEGQIVIDVGINSRELGKLDDEIVLPSLVGDVDYSEVKDVVKAITPVPGGVGQMTVVSLFQNVVDVYKRYRS